MVWGDSVFFFFFPQKQTRHNCLPNLDACLLRSTLRNSKELLFFVLFLVNIPLNETCGFGSNPHILRTNAQICMLNVRIYFPCLLQPVPFFFLPGYNETAKFYRRVFSSFSQRGRKLYFQSQLFHSALKCTNHIFVNIDHMPKLEALVKLCA